jgi:hypothetical protein
MIISIYNNIHHQQYSLAGIFDRMIEYQISMSFIYNTQITNGRGD